MIKILVENNSNIIKCQDHFDYILEATRIKCLKSENSVDFYICDLNENDCSVYEIEDKISGFVGNKYLYINGLISLNPDYTEPEE